VGVSTSFDVVSDNFLRREMNLSAFDFKGRVHCFSLQVVMNKCFRLNLEKNLEQILLVVFEKKAKNVPLIPKIDVIKPKTRRLGYTNYQLKSC